ncbi:hypothetical protein FXO38_27724 [Capsicum annuum]|uniref:proteoglycan 4 n=1 Tax=Capsicum annuum TaxID=4072 RepID=UPI0007BF24EC|nr:proteoglycan 4 [Capsicum annuum]KAF3629383.1 hypothetical protein FXO38_27724 [Capsicum annuum]KAF3629767.1 hypothetical protein FXO37_28790 [Capsicum annuum]
MEKRSTFRFRLPWSQSEAESASKPSTQPNTKSSGPSRTTRQATRSRTTSQSQPSSSTKPNTSPSSSPATENSPPKQPPSAPTTTTSGKPSSPAQPSVGTRDRNEAPASTTIPPPRSPQPQKSAETKAPSQNTTTSTSTLPETPAIPPQPLAESKAPIQSTNTSPLPESSPVPSHPSAATKAPASPKSETQTPTTTITSTPTSTIPQSPQSGPPGVAPSRTESQPLILSQEQKSNSQPASPSDVETKSNAPQPPSASQSHPAPQSQEVSPKSSPIRKGPQVLSTDQFTPKESRPASQVSSNPFDITSQMQPKDQTVSQTTSAPKQSEESSETSSKSSEAKNRSPEKEMQASELSEVRSTRGITEGPSKISDSSRIISEPKTARPLETKNQETEVKEVVQETNDKNHAAGEKTGGPVTSKEQPGIVFQPKQAQASPDDDQIQVNRVSNGKQTRTIPSQLKNKTVSGRKETAGSAEQDIPLNKEVKDNISKLIHRMVVGDGKINLEEGPVSVITLAGDNRGASMQLGSNSSKRGSIQIHRGYKLNADESADTTIDAEGSEGRQSNDGRTMKDQEIEAYMNCNVQGLNNSITFDSFIEGKNPGIHMSFPRTPSETIKTSEENGLFAAHKAEFNATRAQKHTYEPTIRSRCLEGLFLEPSDSDSDNPEKPRRHGCQVGGMEKRENEIDIL